MSYFYDCVLAVIVTFNKDFFEVKKLYRSVERTERCLIVAPPSESLLNGNVRVSSVG